MSSDKSNLTTLGGLLLTGLLAVGALGDAARAQATLPAGKLPVAATAPAASPAVATLSMSCPLPLDVECPGDVPAPATNLDEFVAQGGSVSSDCGGTVSVRFVEDRATGTCPTQITRTYDATDECGNVEFCAQFITVWDRTAPDITCVPDQTVDCGVETKFTATATDNCDQSLDFSAAISGGTNLGNVTLKDLGGGSFSLLFTGDATVVVTVTATDDCGNQASCKTTFTASCAAPAQGCTPGYWKNHPKKWPASVGFTTGTSFNAYFQLTPAQSTFSDSKTMLQALGTGGGSGNNNANLARHGVAALLNIAAGLAYPFPPGIHNATELWQAIHDAYVTGNFGTLAGDLDKANNSGCPLN